MYVFFMNNITFYHLTTVLCDIWHTFNVFLFLLFSAFHDANQPISDEQTSGGTTPSHRIQDGSHGFVKARGSSAASVSGDDTPSEVSELGTPRHEKFESSDHIGDNLTSSHDLNNPTETSVDHAASSQDFINEDNSTDKVAENSGDAIALRLDGADFTPANAHVKRPSTESIGSDLTSSSAVSTLLQDVSHDLPGSRVSSGNSDLLLTLPLDERHKLNRIINTQKQRLATAKTDVEDLVARLNQEMAARQYLVTKVSNTSLRFFVISKFWNTSFHFPFSLSLSVFFLNGQ